MHTFTIDELEVDVTVGPNGEKAVRIPPTGAGTYEIQVHDSGPRKHDGDPYGRLVGGAKAAIPARPTVRAVLTPNR